MAKSHCIKNETDTLRMNKPMQVRAVSAVKT